jgi:hypothetical protein
MRGVTPVDTLNDSRMVAEMLRPKPLEVAMRMHNTLKEKIELRRHKSLHNAIEKQTGMINTKSTQIEMLSQISHIFNNYRIKFNGQLTIS